MALASKYTFSFASVKDGELHSITIKQEGYGGSPIALPYMVGRDFMVLSYNTGNGNLLHPIRGSQLTLRVSLEPDQIQEFILADNRTWYIEWTSNNGWEWYGWLQPQTSVNYSPYGLRELELQFTDNLGSLQTVPDSVLDDNFVELQTLRAMIERQINYTDITLPITISTSVKHDDEIYDYAQDTVFIEQTLSLDYDGVQPQMSYDMLSKLLRLLHCTVYQNAGTWIVENWIDKFLAGYPNDLLNNFDIADRGINIRFESPLSKVTANSHHYQVRHTQTNRDFSDANFDISDNFINFPGWVQQGTNVNPVTDAVTLANKQYARILGNYVSSNTNSKDYLENTGGLVTANNGIRVYVTFEVTAVAPIDTAPQFAVRLNETSDGLDWWLSSSTMTFIKQVTPIINNSNLIANIGDTIIAPVDGTIYIQIYRPDIASLGVTYNPTINYVRWAYAEVLAAKTSNETDYKLFKSVGTKNNKGLRPNEVFETIGLAYDREFSPNEDAAFPYEDFISLQFNDNLGVTKTTGNFVSDYMPTSKPWGLTEFAANTYMRLFAKPQLYAEVELYGKALNIGEIFTINIPGLPDDLPFIVVAYDWNVQADRYSALMAYISYDPDDTITMQRFWLQQNQEDNDVQ